MKKFLSPWILVTVGIIMNIASALIIHILVESNMNRMDKFMQQSETVDLRIDNLWQNYQALQQRQAYFTTLLLSANAGRQLDLAHELINTTLNQLIEQYKLERESVTATTVTIGQLQEIFTALQREVLVNIDNTYLEQIELRQQRQNIAENNARLNSIAIFLQMLGLILVLARDLARHD